MNMSMLSDVSRTHVCMHCCMAKATAGVCANTTNTGVHKKIGKHGHPKSPHAPGTVKYELSHY